MNLTGLHILLTFQCTFECDHCFVWGSPWQTGTLSLDQIRNILEQCKEAGVASVYFEGGEPFLYYAILVRGVELASSMGFQTGVVTNGYWATSLEDAVEWLRPLKMVEDLSVSSDLYHYDDVMSHQTQLVVEAAHQLEIPVGTISIAQPQGLTAGLSVGQIDANEPVEVMYKGRAVRELAAQARQRRRR